MSQASGGIDKFDVVTRAFWVRGVIWFCQCVVLVWRHAPETCFGCAAGGVSHCAVRAACHRRAAAAGIRSIAVGGGCVVLCAGAQRLAAAPPGPAAGRVRRAMQGTSQVGPAHVRGARYRRRQVGAAPLFRRVVCGGQTPRGKRQDGAFPAAQAGSSAGALVCGHIHAGGPSAATAGCAGLPAATGAAGPGSAVPAGAGPIGNRAVRDGSAVGGRDRGGSSCNVSGRGGAGPGTGSRDRPGGHPPVRSGRARRTVAGVGAGDPRRVPPAPARRQSSRPGHNTAGAEAGTAGITAVAAVPAPPTRNPGAAPAAGAASPA
jgi:hypothetical protein